MIPLKDDIPSRSFPFVMAGILVLNVLVFLYELMLGPSLQEFIFKWGAIPASITGSTEIELPAYEGERISPILTIFSSMFLHGGFAHLIGNMLYLYIFADNVEDRIGHIKFLIFYLLCGFIASVSHILSQTHSQIPSIGASGAIAGVLGAYLILYPRASILTLIPFGYFMRIVRLPAIFVLGFWFVIQLFQGLASLPGAELRGGVAWFAHIGGFVAGLILVNLFKGKRKNIDWQ